MRAWIFQDKADLRRDGDKARWSVGWYEPNGKKKQKKIGAKSAAERHARKIEGQLAAGTYNAASRRRWAEFRKEYEDRILSKLATKTRTGVKATFDHFERITKPAKLSAIDTKAIDSYIAARSIEAGKKKESIVSPATINRELRYLKAALRVAHDWGYMPRVPKFRRVREEIRVGRVITPDHFEAIYIACDVATMPHGLHVEPKEWWQALLVFAMTTGWRINEILSFRRADLDLATGAIVTRAADNKGRRDESDFLTPEALAHVKGVVGFGPAVFDWPHDGRTLWVEFKRIQDKAGINLPCPDADRHECTDACRVYGFHALRRGYATLNAETMTAPVLQRKMRHRSFTTTLRYIGLADKMKKATDRVFVPEFLRSPAAGG